MFISRHVRMSVRVLVRLRSDLPRVWEETHPGQSLPSLPPYAFRAWCQPEGLPGGPHERLVVLLVDHTETAASVTWLLLHELVHAELRASPLIAQALARVKKPRDYLTSDEAHQNHAEERIADWIATIWYRQLGFPRPWRRDRVWWRARVTEGATDRASRRA